MQRFLLRHGPVKRERSIVISLSVCLSVCEHISGTAGPTFTKFCVQITCGMARSSSGGVSMCHLLPVLWMTSRLAIVGRMAMRGRLNV